MNYQIQKLDVGQILDQSIKLVKENFKFLFTLYAVTLLPFNLIFVYLQLEAAELVQPGKFQPDAPQDELVAYGIAMAAVYPFLLIAMILFNAASVHAIASLYISRPTDLGDCIKSGAKRMFPLLWTGILTFLAVLCGLPLACVGAVIFAMWFCLAQQVCVIEGISGPDAMGRSKALMKDNMMKAFVLGLVVFAIQFGVGIVGGIVKVPIISAVIQSVVGGATGLFGSTALVILYFSARCEHENFDLQMLSSAVADDSETPPSRFDG